MDTLELIARRLDKIEEALHHRPDIDQTTVLNTAKPFLMDYQNRRLVYAWSPVVVALSIEEYGTILVPPLSWTNINVPEGVRITTIAGSAQVLFRFTDHALASPSPAPMQTAIANGYGYVATTGSLTDTDAGGQWMALSVFNPAKSGKVLVVDRMNLVYGTTIGVHPDIQVSLQTTDPAYAGTAITPANLNAGGPASVASATQTAVNGHVAISGTVIFVSDTGANVGYEVLQQGEEIRLSAGNGVTLFLGATNTTTYAMNIWYREAAWL